MVKASGRPTGICVGEVAGSHPTARTFIVLSRGAATKTRNVKSERGEISSKVLEVY